MIILPEALFQANNMIKSTGDVGVLQGIILSCTMILCQSCTEKYVVQKLVLPYHQSPSAIHGSPIWRMFSDPSTCKRMDVLTLP